MNRKEFVKELAAKIELSQNKTNEVLSAAFDIIQEQVAAGESVDFVGFGSFSSHASTERTGRNPKTGEAMIIPAKVTPKFKAGKGFRESVAGNDYSCETCTPL